MQFLTPVAGMDTEDARTYLREHKEGTYTLLDVRQPSEYERGHIPGDKVIPLPELAGRLGEIDSQKPVIAYWAVGGRSRAAAQFLAGQGFNEVYNLKGGIMAWQGLKAFGPAEMGMFSLRGNETPQEVIVLAYGMEQGLAEFYSRVSAMTLEAQALDLYTRYAQKAEDVQSRSVLHDIAEEEKGHLAALGGLVEARAWHL